jgi:hypothetical protein
VESSCVCRSAVRALDRPEMGVRAGRSHVARSRAREERRRVGFGVMGVSEQ